MPFPRTLVAEDDPRDANLLYRAFQQAGLSAAVHFVSDGLEVIDYLRGKQLSDTTAATTLPGLLLLNLQMPGLSGFVVLDWLRQHPHLRPDQIVVLSASQSPTDLARVVALGADHYLVKPDGEADLDSFIQDLIELSHGRLVA